MPVDVLWVEGNLDAEVFNAVLALARPGLVIRKGGSRSELQKRVKWSRESPSGASAYFVCDRDFRETEADRSEPYEERLDGKLVGWHLCRHDIESYLIEPALLASAMKRDLTSVQNAVMAAAGEIQHYAAARWVVGSLRPGVPFSYDLTTAPEELGDYQLPKLLDRTSQQAWCREHVARFRFRSAAALSDDMLDREMDRHFRFFDSHARRSIQSILYWFPGKNLLPMIAKKLGLSGVGDLLPKIKSRLAKNPEILGELPEFRALVAAISAT